MKHSSIYINNDTGEPVEAHAPIIISASRSTDIPAFYADWFFKRLEVGYVKWRNPFNGKDSYVSFANTLFIVFWSKNPTPIIPYLNTLKERGIGCYIQFTLNDYGQEGLEPGVPPLAQRIATFRKLADELGVGSVVWRFDPLLLTNTLTIDKLLNKIEYIGDQLKGYTEKLVFSFADISIYKKVARNLRNAGIDYCEWDDSMMREFAMRLSDLNRNKWGYTLATCAEALNLEEFGIEHNRCIDPELICRLSPQNSTIQNYLYNVQTDKGQRKACGCILSKDIGSYNTCAHGCAYCYANASPSTAIQNSQRHILSPNLDSII